MRTRARCLGWLGSVLLHGLLLGAATVGGPHGSGPSKTGAGIDTRVPGLEVAFTLLDDAPAIRPITPILPTPAPLPKTVQSTPALMPVPAPPIPKTPNAINTPPPVLAANVNRPQPNAVQAAALPSAPMSAGNGNDAVGGRRGTGTGAGTGTAKSLLPVPRAVRSVVFVLDRSTSMGIDDRISAARAQIMVCLRELPEGTRFQVVIYNRQAETLVLAGQTGLAALESRTLAEAFARLEELVAEGGNDDLAALTIALGLQPDVVILLTDADALTPELVRTITIRNRGRCSINTVTFGSAPRQAMQLLAANNRGVCRWIDVGK